MATTTDHARTSPARHAGHAGSSTGRSLHPGLLRRQSQRTNNWDGSRRTWSSTTRATAGPVRISRSAGPGSRTQSVRGLLTKTLIVFGVREFAPPTDRGVTPRARAEITNVTALQEWNGMAAASRGGISAVGPPNRTSAQEAVEHRFPNVKNPARHPPDAPWAFEPRSASAVFTAGRDQSLLARGAEGRFITY